MSPSADQPNPRGRSFPRVSGDEPTLVETLDELPEFSPRERG